MTTAIPLPEFDQETATTRRVLERVPDGKGEWRPHHKSFPLAHLAQLLSWMPGWSVYLRMLDVPLPGIYGPTADEGWSP